MSTLQADPFGEWTPPRFRRRLIVLGSEIDFESDDRALLRLAEHAFAGLPATRQRRAPRLRVRLRVAPHGSPAMPAAVPPVRFAAGAGVLTGSIDAANFACIVPEARTALVNASKQMLRFPYLLRYELIEFAVLTLAARASRLVPLHAGCVGALGRGALLLGASGAGKSTLALQALVGGLDYLAEDSVFVDQRLRAVAVPAFLHVRCDSLAPLDAGTAALVRCAPVIRRRSGVQKFELDLRAARWRVAAAPLPLAAVIVLSTRLAGTGALLRPLSPAILAARLLEEQPYAALQPEWPAFRRRIASLPAFEMRRGARPADSALALRALLLSLANRRVPP